MTKAEIVKQIAGQTGLESKMVAGVVEALLEQIRAAQIGGENVYFRGFGSFVRRERAAEEGPRHLAQHDRPCAGAYRPGVQAFEGVRRVS